MASSKLSSNPIGLRKSKNKELRKIQYVKLKRAQDSAKRQERFRRKREEDQDVHLKAERLANNIPVTIDKKRKWDDVGGDEEDSLGLSVDVEQLKKRKEEESQKEEAKEKPNLGVEESDDSDDDEIDSMLGSDSDEGTDSESALKAKQRSGQEKQVPEKSSRAPSPPSSISTNLDLTPESLLARFPTLINPSIAPKILVTTSLNSTLHKEASLLTTLFPDSTYIPRSGHHYSYKYSVREIASFASNRAYTTLIIMNEDQKRPCGLDVVHLPSGPMFHFSIKNWIEGKKIPGHGNPTDHKPELILNNFRTPLGLLTAHLFRTMFPPQPEFQGRQVVTLHNQRDYIFVRQHRYVFRDKRKTEKSVTDTNGKPMKGVEEIRAGLQELGPRFTLKLRRIDRGIQRRSGQEWEWKAGSEKQRTRFQL